MNQQKFIDKLVKALPFEIKEIQTDNGFEFTNRLSWNIGTREEKHYLRRN